MQRTGKAPLFSFVVVADTHVNEADDTSSSPYETNRAANDRARHVFREIAAMEPQPSFVIHLGDIVHPVPSLPTFAQAVAQFKAIASQSNAPLHVLPGNHDVGDKKVDWMPADQVCEGYLRIYREAFGPDYYAFDQGPVRFVAINSLLLNSGLADETRQREWLEQQITDAEGGRVYLFMHYPPYIYSEKERSSYDNIDEPARSWLLAQMRRPQVEAVFAGHVHNFWYDRVGNADFYMLPSTAFLRHDFSEFYRVAPAAEFGRGDVEKFGYFVVDVYSDCHVPYSVRTHGQKMAAGSAPATQAPVYLAHPMTSAFDRVGVELRHPWAESTQISATGGVQEFGRKWARNDYPLLALWEMGVRLAKVPDMDVAEVEPRKRMELMARMGHRYIVTCLGRPRLELTRDELAAAGIVAVEVNATLASIERQHPALRDWRETTGAQVYLSKIHTFDDSHFDGKHFSHFVKAGLTLAELETSVDVVRTLIASGALDGVTVRVEPEEDITEAARLVARFTQTTGAPILASLKTSGPDLATERADDPWLVLRTAQALLLSRSLPNVRWVFDTFMDVDRGYFPRHGFIDRRFDPRPAARAYTKLTALLSMRDVEVQPGATAGSLLVSTGAGRYELLGCAATDSAALLAERPCQWVHDLVQGTRYAPSAYLRAAPEVAANRLQVLLLETSR